MTNSPKPEYGNRLPEDNKGNEGRTVQIRRTLGARLKIRSSRRKEALTFYFYKRRIFEPPCVGCYGERGILAGNRRTRGGLAGGPVSFWNSLRSLLFNSFRPAVLAAALALLPAAAQAQAIQAWVQRYNGLGNGDDEPSAMAVDANGDVYVTGYSIAANGYRDYATVKYSSAGTPMWTNYYNGPGDRFDQANALALDVSGNIIVTGKSVGTGSCGDYATIKYSGAGVALWTNRYNGPANNDDNATAIAVDGSGNLVVTGQSWNGANYDCLTIKYSSAGVPLWTTRFNGSGNGDDSPTAVAMDATGGVVVTGTSWSGGAASRFATINYSSDGLPLWTNFFGGGNDFVSGLALDSSGNVIVSGGSHRAGTGMDFAMIKYSSAGVPLWTNYYTGRLTNGNDYPFAVAADASGNVVVMGGSDGSGTLVDYGTIKYSSAGELLWTNFYNGPANNWDEARAGAVDPSGNVYVTGYSLGYGSGNDIATVAYSSSGLPLWTNRYNGPGNAGDSLFSPRLLAVDASGNVYVAGTSANNDAFPHEYGFVTVKYVVPPIIIRQPQSRTNACGTTAFAVEATGTLPLSYQWRRDGTNLVDGGRFSGATATNLLLANVQPADACGYTVVVTNSFGSVTSSVAQLTVPLPPGPGRFANFTYSPVIGFSFIFRDATVAQPYRIQRSVSAAAGSWTDWQSFTYTEPIGLTDVGAPGAERRFYRAITP